MSVPVISLGTTATNPIHKQHTLLANLIGGNTDGNFLILNAGGVYPNATMTVTLNHFGCS
jgi:hypothetical protein